MGKGEACLVLTLIADAISAKQPLGNLLALEEASSCSPIHPNQSQELPSTQEVIRGFLNYFSWILNTYGIMNYKTMLLLS